MFASYRARSTQEIAMGERMQINEEGEGPRAVWMVNKCDEGSGMRLQNKWDARCCRIVRRMGRVDGGRWVGGARGRFLFSTTLCSDHALSQTLELTINMQCAHLVVPYRASTKTKEQASKQANKDTNKHQSSQTRHKMG